MASLKIHVYAALRFLLEHEEALYKGICGESLFLDDFRNAFFIGAIFPDFDVFAPVRPFVTHDDPALLACPACAAPVGISDAECAVCKSEWWPGKHKFQTRFKRPSADAEDFWKVHVAAGRTAARLAEETRRGRLPPLNFALGDKQPYPARLRLGADFFKSMAKRDFGKAGLPALEGLTREHLGFFMGVVHHLAADRARDFADLPERMSWEAAAWDLAGDEIARVGDRLKLWAAAPKEGRAAVGQAAYAIVGRWPGEARIYMRLDLDGKPAEQWPAKYPVKDDTALIQARLPAFVAAAAEVLAAPPDKPDALRKLVEPHEECCDRPWWASRSGARPQPPPAPPDAPPVPPSPLDIEAEVVQPAARATRAILEKGYPEPAADAERVFHAAPRPRKSDLTTVYEVYTAPSELAEHFEERGTMRWADATRGQGRDFDLESVKSGDSKGEKDWKDLRTMDHEEFVLYCTALAGRLGEDASRDAREKPVYSGSATLKLASRNWAVGEPASAPPPPPPPAPSPQQGAPPSPQQGAPAPGGPPAPAPPPPTLPVDTHRDDLIVLRLPSGEVQDVGIAVGDGMMIHNHAADPFPPRVRGSHVKRIPPLVLLKNLGPDRSVALYESIQVGRFVP